MVRFPGPWMGVESYPRSVWWWITRAFFLGLSVKNQEKGGNLNILPIDIFLLKFSILSFVIPTNILLQVSKKRKNDSVECYMWSDHIPHLLHTLLFRFEDSLLNF